MLKLYYWVAIDKSRTNIPSQNLPLVGKKRGVDPIMLLMKPFISNSAFQLTIPVSCFNDEEKNEEIYIFGLCLWSSLCTVQCASGGTPRCGSRGWDRLGCVATYINGASIQDEGSDKKLGPGILSRNRR